MENACPLRDTRQAALRLDLNGFAVWFDGPTLISLPVPMIRFFPPFDALTAKALVFFRIGRFRKFDCEILAVSLHPDGWAGERAIIHVFRNGRR
jgi:hypothetical protein